MPTKPKKAPAKKPAAKKAPAKKASHKPERSEVVEHKVVHHVAPHVVAAPADAVRREKFESTTGKRKTAIARVRYYALGTGEMSINGMTLEKYFSFPLWVDEARAPLTQTGWAKGRWLIKANGGGKHAQAQAVRHGISRMLVLLEPTLRATIKPLGYLTRDARVKERKKYGLKRARRAPQWQKR